MNESSSPEQVTSAQNISDKSGPNSDGGGSSSEPRLVNGDQPPKQSREGEIYPKPPLPTVIRLSDGEPRRKDIRRKISLSLVIPVLLVGLSLLGAAAVIR